MTGMDDLTVFVTARLDEDEVTAKAVTFRSHFVANGYGVESPGGRGRPAMPIADVIDPETSAHIALHDPARVLRRVEWTRHMLNTIASLAQVQPSFADCLLSEMAMEWSDHPDYRQEWKP